MSAIGTVIAFFVCAAAATVVVSAIVKAIGE